MGLMDDLLKQSGGLGAVGQLVAKNPQLLVAAASLLSTKETSIGGSGGLGSLVGAFQKQGLGDVMSSWVATGENKPISAGALSQVLGQDTLGQFAKKAGIGAGDASNVLASLLPMLVNQVTPQGKVPETSALDATLSGLFSGLKH